MFFMTLIFFILNNCEKEIQNETNEKKMFSLRKSEKKRRRRKIRKVKEGGENREREKEKKKVRIK